MALLLSGAQDQRGGEAMKTFETTNRKLENFLYVHRISFIKQRKTEDGLNCWEYVVTDEFKRVIEEYKELYCEKGAR